MPSIFSSDLHILAAIGLLSFDLQTNLEFPMDCEGWIGLACHRACKSNLDVFEVPGFRLIIKR